MSVFNDVKNKSITASSDVVNTSLLDNITSMKIGTGAQCFKADQYSGIWLGANKFADAPFSVDLDGNVIANSLDLTTYISKSGTNEQVSGTIRLGTGTGAASII
jgi:hypothetical protein